MKVLCYNKRTGVFTWKETLSHRAMKGLVAGTNSYGYVVIAVDGTVYRAHRLAWLIVIGRWPKGEIDHKNRKRSDNRWTNLREASRMQNNGNSRRPSNNTSGFKGVSWHKQRRKWAAYINIHYKTTYLGLYKTPQKAHAAYMKAARNQFGEFARAA